MAFPRPYISKLSGGACPQTPLVWDPLGAPNFRAVRTPSKSHATPLVSTQKKDLGTTSSKYGLEQVWVNAIFITRTKT